MMNAYNGEQRRPRALSVEIRADNVTLAGDLCIPDGLRGAVLFAHGSGSSRHSLRNRFVARVLQEVGIASLLLDLLTEPEEALDRDTVRLRFDIEMLAKRLHCAAGWLSHQREINRVKLGCFGASTGAAAALVLASESKQIAAVVSRGGRPDLAEAALPKVNAPVLLIVGSEDRTVLDMNRTAITHLAGERKLEIVSGATHLFEEPGTLEQAAQLARLWFERHLARAL
jgi:dienelactone hydrolase